MIVDETIWKGLEVVVLLEKPNLMQADANYYEMIIGMVESCLEDNIPQFLSLSLDLIFFYSNSTKFPEILKDFHKGAVQG